MLTQSHRQHHIIHIIITLATLHLRPIISPIQWTPCRPDPRPLPSDNHGIMDGRQVEKGGHYRGLIRGGEHYADGGDDLDDVYRQNKYIDIKVMQRSLVLWLSYILVQMYLKAVGKTSSGSSCSSSRSSFIWLVIYHQARQQDIRIPETDRIGSPFFVLSTFGSSLPHLSSPCQPVSSSRCFLLFSQTPSLYP